MRIEADAVIPFDRPTVYHTYRDELQALVAHLPNVRDIEVEKRSEEPNQRVRLVNVWHGGGEIPATIRKVIDSSMLSWHDYATWDEADWTTEWRIETHSFREAVRCTGRNRFIEIGSDRTRLEIHGEIHIDGKRVRGIPAFVAGTLGRTVEQFLVKHITLNLTSISDGITRYLESRN